MTSFFFFIQTLTKDKLELQASVAVLERENRDLVRGKDILQAKVRGERAREGRRERGKEKEKKRQRSLNGYDNHIFKFTQCPSVDIVPPLCRQLQRQTIRDYKMNYQTLIKSLKLVKR